MIAPPNPENETRRLAALHALRILDTPAEERFDRITRIAQKLFDVPIALVSLVDAERQWFKSRVGLDASETPREISFCGHAILQTGPFVVSNALEDERFRNNPLVTGDPNIRFYAGQPLQDIEGNKLGTLCLIDRHPRKLDKDQLQLLHDLGIWVENELNTASLSNVLHRLQKSEQRYQTLAHEAMEATSLKQAILDSANYSIISTDTDGTIRTFNQVAQSWLGYAPGEIIGKLTPAVIHDPEEVAQHAKTLATELGTPIEPGFEVFVAKARLGMADENEWSYIRKDGSRFPVRLSVTALKNGAREITGFLAIASDISAHKQAERQRDRFFNMSLDMMCIVGFDGYIRQLNPAWEETLGFSDKELKAELFGKFLHRDDRDRVMAETEKLMQGRVISNFECRHRCRDGSYKWMLWNATAYVEEQLIYAVARDITERIKIEQMQNEFVSTVSHELRTPLTSIRGALGLVSGGVGGELPAKAGELIGIAHKNCERLVQLINDILDSEKIASGKMRFSLRPLEIMPLVQQAVAANQLYASQFGVNLKITDELSEVCLLADPDRLIQVMNNLLANAAKFSPNGGEVSVSVRRNGGYVHVSVSDQGPGIKPEFHGRIFQRFFQVDASDTRKKGGTGLGLSISKMIIEKMGGRIGFISEPGRGATFHFDMPELQEKALMEHTPEGNRPCVLVCEDDAEVAMLLRMMLGSAGLNVDVCYNASQAKDFLLKGGYDLMTVDLQLPGQDGISLIRELRGDSRTRNIPIVVISAIVDEGQNELNGGAFEIVDWLNKPIDQQQLMAAVHKAIDRTGNHGTRILHIEDDPDVRRLLSELFQDTVEIVAASTLREARSAIAQNGFNLIILDIGLPDGSGVEILSDLKSRNLSIPIMVFSADDFDVNASDLVASALVKSRTTNDELAQMIKGLLRQRHGSRPRTAA